MFIYVQSNLYQCFYKYGKCNVNAAMGGEDKSYNIDDNRNVASAKTPCPTFLGC